MKKELWITLPLVLLFGSGCTPVDIKRIDDLETKVKELEKRMAVVEDSQTIEQPLPQESSVQKIDSFSLPDTDISLTSEEIQTALKNSGFYDGPVDGKIGPKTRKAIEDFQSANSLKIDGTVGVQTKNLLKKYLTKDQKSGLAGEENLNEQQTN